MLLQPMRRMGVNPGDSRERRAPALILTGSGAAADFDCDCQHPTFGASDSFDCDCQSAPLTFDNDCHHPDLPLALATAGGGPYVWPSGAYSAPLPHGFYLAHSPYAAGPAVLGPLPYRRYRRFRDPAPLTDATDHSLARLALLHPLSGPPLACAATPLTLTAWLHVSNACNLDCPYCYVRKSSERMSLATGRGAVAAVFRTAAERGFRQVKLKYAGGEATLHFALIRQLHDYAAALADRSGISLREVILTNGVRLRPADADWLAEHGVKLMLSLDGVGELHNRLRPARGRADFDTFAAVEHTVDHVLRPRGIRPDVSMTVTGLNAHGAADVARWALLERALPTGFSFYRSTPLSRGRAELALEEQTLIAGMSAAYDAIEADLPTQPFTGGLLDRTATDAHHYTCGVGQNYLVIGHTGALAQCPMHLGTPLQSDLSGDLLALVSAGPLRNLPVSEKEGCRDCAFRHQCAGGCPLETFRATGRWDVRSPNCNLYTTLLPRVWRLEGLRLMKRHGYLS